MNLGGRIKAERESRRWAQAELARRAELPEESGQQTIQKLEERNSERSKYAPALAKALGLNLQYALTGEGPKYVSEAGKSVGVREKFAGDYHGSVTGLLDSVARQQIGSRLMYEIKRTRKNIEDVAARVRLDPKEFQERAQHGDLTLEDLVEIVWFLGKGASLDYIVMGRFPTADTMGAAGEIMRDLKFRAGDGVGPEAPHRSAKK